MAGSGRYVETRPPGERKKAIRVAPELGVAAAVPLFANVEWQKLCPWLVQGTTARGRPAEPVDFRLTGPRVAVADSLRRRRTLLEALNCRAAVCANQAHAGRALWHSAYRPGITGGQDAEGHATRLPQLLLTITIADCVPVFVADPHRRAVAILHAGRGTAREPALRALPRCRAGPANMVRHLPFRSPRVMFDWCCCPGGATGRRSGGWAPTFFWGIIVDGSLELELRKRIENTGFDLVEFTRAGSRTRPILRLRIDRLEAGPRSAVTVDDCAMVSRALEPFLDAFEGLGQRYLLEVSSPGVERPLVRSRDFERFAGQEVALHGEQPLAGTSRRLHGELLGLVEREGKELVRVRIAPGEVVEVPRDALTRAHLVFRWVPQD